MIFHRLAIHRLPGVRRGAEKPLDSGSRSHARNDDLKSLAVAAIVFLATILSALPARAADTREADQHFFNLNTGDLKAEAGDAKHAGKKAILIMFEQEGCPGCLYMKRNVLNRADVQKYYREHFLNFPVDVHGAVPIRDFAGRDHTEKSYAQALRVNATPTFAFFDLAGEEIARVAGPVKDAAEFMLLGEFIASGAYRFGKFAEYKRRKERGS